MRTTVTLDSDVERFLKDEAHRTRKSFKAVLNDTIRQALKPPASEMPVLLPPRRLGVMRGVDPRRLSELADEMEVDAHLEVTRRLRDLR